MTNNADRRIRSFTGRTSREVYARIRAELGEDAVILNQSRRDGMVTVQAASDFPEPAEPVSPGTDIFQRRLLELGFAANFVARLPAMMSWQQVKDTITDTVIVESPPQRLLGRYRFVGASGVGKTTSIIKLMAEQVLNYGPRSCAAVSTDLRRLAGTEQLALAAELLGVEFRETAPQRLDETLAALADRELVLIDTAGVNAVSDLQPQAGVPDVLVLPATWRAAALRKTAARLSRENIAGVVVSHVDQTDSLADIIPVLADLRVPIRWQSDSPDLYDDLKPMNRQMLRDLLFPEIDRSQISTTFA